MTENEMKVKLHKIIAENSEFTTWTISTPHIMMLVQQAIEEEREACAKICEKEQEEWGWDSDVMDAAAAIRERSANARARGQE